MNDYSYFSIFNFQFSIFNLLHVSRHHAVLFLKTFGEIGGGSKAYGIRDLGDALIGSEQQLVGTVQAGGSQQLDWR